VAPDGRDTVETCRQANDRLEKITHRAAARHLADLDAARPLPGASWGITVRRSDRLNYAYSNAGGLRISIPPLEPQAPTRRW
jgi:hypothetical protein